MRVSKLLFNINTQQSLFSSKNICCHATVALTSTSVILLTVTLIQEFRAYSTLVLYSTYEMSTHTVQGYLCMQITLTLLCSRQYQLLRYSPDNEHSMSASECVFGSVYLSVLHPTSLTQYSN